MSVFSTKILLATDGSDESDLVATTAELAKSTDSELDVIYVLEGEPGHLPPRGLVPYPRRYEDLKEESQRIRDRHVEKIEASGGSVSNAHLTIGLPADQIVAYAQDEGVGLIAWKGSSHKLT